MLYLISLDYEESLEGAGGSHISMFHSGQVKVLNVARSPVQKATAVLAKEDVEKGDLKAVLSCLYLFLICWYSFLVSLLTHCHFTTTNFFSSLVTYHDYSRMYKCEVIYLIVVLEVPKKVTF